MWQPIETAPKDGRLLRLKRIYKDSVIAEGVGYWGLRDEKHPNVKADNNIEWWIREGGQYLFPTPTHWMPST